MTFHSNCNVKQCVDCRGRQIALKLQSLMALVEFGYNGHEPCMVCGNKYSKHIDKLPCESDVKQKVIVKRSRWDK